jgi:ring-1,2-phenylacetyl-CoA epoxidase subunit PaaD
MSVHNPRTASSADKGFEDARSRGKDVATAARVVSAVPDPEMPYLTLGDLGVVREVSTDSPDSVRVLLTPTYLGCPATEAIRGDVAAALRDAGWPRVAVEYRFDPPWTPDRITLEGRRKLAAEGIAPPGSSRPAAAVSVGPVSVGPVSVELSVPTRVLCPRCGAEETLLLSAFGAAPCQELRRCPACGEPFPAIKAAR